MITKLYIDNFRCLVNFDLQLHANQLWLGVNGTGKSSVLDVLRKVQHVLDGAAVTDIFSVDDLTLWQTKNTQTIRFSMTLDADQYDYQLIVEYERKQRHCRIRKEQLAWNGNRFFHFDGEEAHLFRIHRTTGEVEKGTQFSADWGRSMIPSIAERDDNQPLVKFRRSVSKWLLVQPVPALVEHLAAGETRRLQNHAENFAQWYRHASQENSKIGFDTWQALKKVLPGFESLNLRESGDSRRLAAVFRFGNEECEISFRDLSDGQRQLVILYVMLYSLKHSHDVLFVDEPDNFVCLREIQPWLLELQDICHDAGRQAIIISHHPEVVNRMVDGSEIFFSRAEAGHIVIGKYPETEGITPSETMARGWEDG